MLPGPFRHHSDTLLVSVFDFLTLVSVTFFLLALMSKLLERFLYSMAENWKNLKDTIIFSPLSIRIKTDQLFLE